MDFRQLLGRVGKVLLTVGVVAQMQHEEKQFGETAGHDPDAGEQHADAYFRGAEGIRELWRPDAETPDI